MVFCACSLFPFRIKHQNAWLSSSSSLVKTSEKEKSGVINILLFFVLRGKKYCVFYPSVIKEKIPKEMVRRVVKETHIYYLLLHKCAPPVKYLAVTFYEKSGRENMVQPLIQSASIRLAGRLTLHH